MIESVYIDRHQALRFFLPFQIRILSRAELAAAYVRELDPGFTYKRCVSLLKVHGIQEDILKSSKE